AKFKDQPLLFSGDGSYDEDGEVVGYYWDFGDGTHSPTDNEYAGYMPSKVTSHKYEKIGKYVVTLRVKDDDGATSSDANVANINVQVRTTGGDTDTPFPYLAVGIGIGALLVLLTIASSSFIWLRKRV
ncbi:MAG: PKD domain-containing protein, partial [Candidatus Thermoplasmatota archaeon]|nr:PKD domain-containing protein [Candidatus Thermoplasmatota archaeon]